jgi:hypothetical protein
MRMTNSMYHVFQTSPDDVIPMMICSSMNEEECQDEADRINNGLAMRGIPTYVSCAYVTL